MIGGLLAGAMAGGAEAAQDNARTRIKQMHDDAILRMQQKFATSERVAGQEFSKDERIAEQGFTAGENEANRGHDLTLTQMREQGANSRSGAQIAAGDRRAQMGLLQQGMNAEGSPVWFNPVSGDRYDAPPGVTLADDGELTPVQGRRLDSIQSEKEALRATFEDGVGGYRQPTNQEAEYLQTLQEQENAILYSRGGSAGSGAPTPFEVLMAGESGGDTGEPAPGASGGGNPPPAGGSAPPPRPGQPAPASSTQEPPGNFSGLINQAMADQSQQQANRQSAAEQRQIESQINTIRGLAARAGRGPGMSQADRDSLGRQAVEQAEALMQQGNLTAEQVQRLRSAAENVVRFTELDFN